LDTVFLRNHYPTHIAVPGSSVLTDGVSVSFLYVLLKPGAKHKADVISHPQPESEDERDFDMMDSGDQGYSSVDFKDIDIEPPTPPQPPPNIPSSFLKLVANDPGRVRIASLARCVEVYLKGGGSPVLAMRFKQYTLEMWRSQTHAERRLQRADLWCAPIETHFARLATVTKKTASLETLADFLRVFTEVQGPVLHEKMKPKWRREAFRSWRAKKQAADKWWVEGFSGSLEDNNFKMGSFMAYGGAKFSSSSPGLHSTPTTSFYAACAHIAKVTGNKEGVVDEYRTSVCCSSCGSIMSKVYTKELTPRRLAKNEKSFLKWGRVNPFVADTEYIRGLYFCSFPGCPNNGRRLKDRDNSAGSNLVQLGAAALLGMQRPSYLSRGKGGKVAHPPPVFLTRVPSGIG
jgi:hypothetical protein